MEEIQTLLLQHCRSTFASCWFTNSVIEEAITTVPTRVAPEMNSMLALPFTASEVKSALFSMSPFKSPGPNGMLPLFFQNIWSIVGGDVTQSILSILNDHTLLNIMNFTHVVLIPKLNDLEFVTQFRPINLCNVVIKIASKCVANRLKGIMHSIVSASQSAFILDRLITDNVLLAFKLNHYLKVSSRSKNASVALQLDMSKAYDKVEWPFLRCILLKLGFESRFVHLIMLLVTTLSYSLTLNGEHFGFFRSERGIRQGDPLSPYLFIFVAEAFSCILQEAERRGMVQGVAVCASVPKISHLLFADDTLLFCKAKDEQIQEIQCILTMYERASGQVVNFAKASMVVSGRIGEEEKRRLARRLGVRLVYAHDRYLGLPAVAGRSRWVLFHNIRDRMWAKITGWNSKLLSQAGKGVLIKSVLQALPTYAMSCFKLPGNLVRELEAAMGDFWWHSRGEKRIHWVAWR